MATWTAGRLSDSERNRVEAHLAACGSCRSQWVYIWGLSRNLSAITPRHRFFRRFRGAAAILAALAGGGFLFFVRQEGALDRFVPVPIALEAILSGGASGAYYRLPEGSRLRLDPGAAVRIAPVAPGERICLELLTGKIWADVSQEKGVFRIRAAAGDLQVLGTTFAAAVFRIPRISVSGDRSADLESQPLECFSVDVLAGKVALASAYGRVIVNASARGLMLADRTPVLLDQEGTLQRVLAQTVPVLESRDGAFRVRPGLERQVEFLAALYKVLPEAPSFARTPEERAALALLEGAVCR